MCGIAGIFHYAPTGLKVNRQELRAVCNQMAKRGPDDFGEWFSEDYRLALGHRRLSIIDLTDKGRQPMKTKDNSLVIVFNGEIYNYKILRKTLEEKGHLFHSHSDTEVLLYLYKEYGIKMFAYLRGMYAFALWDENKEGLLLARDPLGIKPLYFADNGKTIRVASQVKALLESDGIDKKFDPSGQAGFLLWGYVPEPYTIYKAIRSLPSGSYMWIDKHGNHRSETFLDIADILAQVSSAEIDLAPFEIKKYVHDAISESVKHHLIADVPVGIFLSAGLDSTVITALASEIEGEDLKTFTIGFDECRGTVFDETVLAEKVAKTYGAEHETVWISKKDFEEEAPKILLKMDQPSIDGINNYFVSKVVSERGLKVALSGLGGDEIFGTYKTFKYIPIVTTLTKFNKCIPRFGKSFRRIMSQTLKGWASQKYAGLFEFGCSVDRAYFLGRSCFMPWELPKILGVDRACDGLEGLQPHFSNLEKMIEKIHGNYFKIMSLEMTQYMRGQLLRHTDWAGMSHSLEVRVPLVDIELLRSLSPLFSLPNRPTKTDMAKSVKKSLPSSLFFRKKTGFYTPLNRWLNSRGGNLVSKRSGFRQWALYVHEYFSNPEKNPGRLKNSYV